MTPQHLHLVDQPELRPEAILVRDTLIEKGLETPMIDTGLSATQKYERIKELMGEVAGRLALVRTHEAFDELASWAKNQWNELKDALKKLTD